MYSFNEKTDRKTEIIVGATSILIASSLFVLLIALLLKAPAKPTIITFEIVLASLSYWFGSVGIRLVFNLPRKDGGLLSPTGLKVLSLFLGICSCLMLPYSIYLERWDLPIYSFILLIGCISGWKVAKVRGGA